MSWFNAIASFQNKGIKYIGFVKQKSTQFNFPTMKTYYMSIFPSRKLFLHDPKNLCTQNL